MAYGLAPLPITLTPNDPFWYRSNPIFETDDARYFKFDTHIDHNECYAMDDN